MENSQNTLFSGILLIVIVIVLFIVFRKVSLWYWKIEDLILNQRRQERLIREQNNILEKIYIQLGGNVNNENQLPKNGEQTTEDENEVEISRLDEDFEKVENLKKVIKSDEIIVKVKKTGRIEKWKKSEWDDILKIGNQDKFVLIFSNKN